MLFVNRFLLGLSHVKMDAFCVRYVLVLGCLMSYCFASLYYYIFVIYLYMYLLHRHKYYLVKGMMRFYIYMQDKL